MQKQSAFQSTQEFIDASLAAGVLILSNNDAAMIKDLGEQQKKGFKRSLRWDVMRWIIRLPCT